MLTKVHIGVIKRIPLMDLTLQPNSSYTCSLGFMTGDVAGQCKTLTLFLAWNCVVIYALCEALQCHAGKSGPLSPLGPRMSKRRQQTLRLFSACPGSRVAFQREKI